MIKFKNLHEAFRYQTQCPFCKAKIHIGWIELRESEGEEYVTLKAGTTSFVINCDDNVIAEYTDSGAIFNGMFIFHVLSVCTDCSKYSYSLQVHADLTKMRVAGIFFNAETFSIEKGPILHEIRNAYSLDQTEYSFFSNVKGEELNPHKSINLPLIPMNLEDPDKTLQRIKNLIIFS